MKAPYLDFPKNPGFRRISVAIVASTVLGACGGGGGTATETVESSTQAGGSITSGADGSGPSGNSAGPTSPGSGSGNTGSSSGNGGTGDGGDGAGTTTGLAPDVVTGLGATVENQRVIVLNWPGAARAARYDLYWSVSAGVDLQTANRIENVTSPFRHEGLLGGIAYHYRIRAINAAGVSEPSAEASAALPPGAVTGFSVTSGDSAVSLSWIEPPHATGYRIYWAETLDGLNSQAARIDAGSPPFVHSGLRNGNAYHYVIAAIGAAGEGPLSPPISAQAQAPVPTAPREVSAQVNPDDGGSIILTWQAPQSPINESDILHYNLYRSIEPGIAGKESGVVRVTQTSAGYFIDSVPVTSIPYYYVVTAMTTSGEGAPSPEVSASATGDSDGPPNDDRDIPDGVFDCGEPLECWTRGSVRP